MEEKVCELCGKADNEVEGDLIQKEDLSWWHSECALIAFEREMQFVNRWRA